MAELQNSKLLSMILAKAESLSRDYSCKGTPRDFIVVAAIRLLSQPVDGADSEEREKALAVVSRYTRDDAALVSVLESWRGKETSMTEKIVYSRFLREAEDKAKAKSRSEITADILLEVLTASETTGMSALREGEPIPDLSRGGKPIPPTQATGVESGPKAGEKKPEEKKAEAPKPADQNAAAAPADQMPSYISPNKQDMASIVARTQHLHTELQKRVLGQDHAISVFTAGYFNAELQAAIDKERTRPRGIFLFAGPPGVGKTYLAESAAKILGLRSKRFDMSGYVNPSATDDLCGYDKNYRSSKEGELTGFVNKYPECVLIFDEIEKASMEVILLFLQILDAGQLKDNRTEENVSFKHAILIFTTNEAKQLYEDKQDENLSLVSREVILDALKKEKKPRTDEPLFPAAICSRFASGNVLMFNHLRAHTLTHICRGRLNHHMENMEKTMNVKVEMDRSIPSALLLAEGASADGRMVNSRADLFFSSELYELYRLLPKEEGEDPSGKIRKIRFSLDLESCPKEIRDLFIPVEQPHVAVFGRQGVIEAPQNSDGPVIHYVSSLDECSKLMDTEKIEMLIANIDGEPGQVEEAYLNFEDIETPERSFLYGVMKSIPSLPVVLYDDEANPFTSEEKDSYAKRGVRDFLSNRSGAKDMKEILEEIFQQNKLSELARANKLLHFETKQKLSADHTEAEIVLFDLSLEKAIKSEDAGNVMSLLSTPNVKFDEVIGAEEAKKELKFFINYMRNPKKYRRNGAAAPKGVLLYGPPGTGKTMLAKAFASESGATFIAATGSQFFNKYIGESPALVRKMFATARRYAPSVLFVDEIDVIARARTGGDTATNQVTEEILTTFFAEMDGFSTDPTKPVFVLGATNYGMNDRMALDPAMLRRFDRRLMIDLPSPENREKYLRMQFEKKSMFNVSEKELKSLAERSTGMSLAQLASIIDLAMRSALQSDREEVGDADIEEAFETFNGGEKRQWSEEITLCTARHEAGHAIVSWLTGDKPTYITIVSRGNYGGYMQHGGDTEDRMGYTRKELLNRIATSLGGRAAELVYYGAEKGMSTGASGDLRTATSIAKKMICELGMDDECGMAVIDPDSPFQADRINQRVNVLLKEQLDEAIRLISEHRDKVDALVAKLLEKNHLNKEEIEEVLS